MATAMVTDMAMVTVTAMTRGSSDHRRVVGARLLPFFLLTGLGIGAVNAGDWTFTESTRLSATYIDRTGDNAQSGAVLQLAPTFTLDGQGGRSRGNVVYTPTFSVGGGSTDPRFFTNDLIARGEIDVVDEVFVLGLNAGAGLQGSTGLASDVDAINVDTDDGRQYYSLGIEPKFFAHLNRYADLVSLNSWNAVWYSRQDDEDREDGSQQRRVHLGVRSGRIFGPLSWRGDVSNRVTDYDDRDDERTEVDAGVGYRVSPKLSVNANAGYEWNDVQTSRSDTDGVTWNVGANYAPTSRTNVSANYGQRYFGNTFDVSANHVSRRTRLSVGLSRDVDNQRNEALVDNFFFLADDAGNPVLDPSTGQPVVVNVPTIQATDEDFINERLRVGILVNGQRTTINLRARVEQRTYEVSGNESDAYYLSFNVSRELGSRYRASVGGDYDFEKDSVFGDSDYYRLRASLSKSIGRETRVSIDYSYGERDADDSNRSYEENRLGLSLYTSFL